MSSLDKNVKEMKLTTVWSMATLTDIMPLCSINVINDIVQF
jgi:hypothetical protein